MRIRTTAFSTKASPAGLGDPNFQEPLGLAVRSFLVRSVRVVTVRAKESTMSQGKIAPYRRSAFAGEGHTGSLLFDNHRQENLREPAKHAAPRQLTAEQETREQFHI